ncbi:hypothetical protein HDU82_004656 [Entophlyctis luteolus]|nr:hypothetical protein HDU82_004656 [Entophlyctis luteolus]
MRPPTPRHSPVRQFFAIKVVLLVSYLQNFLLAALVASGAVHGGRGVGRDGDEWTPGEVANAIACFLTCVEMFAASVVNWWVFGWHDFVVDTGGVNGPYVPRDQDQGIQRRLSSAELASSEQMFFPASQDPFSPESQDYLVSADIISSTDTVTASSRQSTSQPVVSGSGKRITILEALMDAANPSDLWHDAVLVFGLLLGVCGNENNAGSGRETVDENTRLLR